VDISGSPLTITVANAPLDASASYAFGQGLVGGVAGQQLVVNVQTKDTERLTVQYISASASVSKYVPEIQKFVIPPGSSSVKFRYRGMTSGSVSPSTIDNLYAALLQITNATGSVVLTTAAGASTGAYNHEELHLNFTKLRGPLPLMTILKSGSGDFDKPLTASEYVIGDTPYRKAVQVVQCLSPPSAMSLITFSVNGAQTAPVYPGIGRPDIETVFGQAGYGAVTATSPNGATALCSNAGDLWYIEFSDAVGVVPQVVSSMPSNVFVSVSEDVGALSGIAPLWGTFTLSVNGETTVPLSTTATAEDVHNALQNLYSLRDVRVTKDAYGVALAPDEVSSFYSHWKNIFNVWAVTFRSGCTDNSGIVSTGFCAGYTGDEPVMQIDTSNVRYYESPTTQQAKPSITVRKSLKGYPGNVLQDFSALGSLQVAVAPANASVPNSIEVPRAIGMNAVQVKHNIWPSRKRQGQVPLLIH
jgi:hypothetical protein